MAKFAKPWKLTEEETFSSFTAWQHNIVYTLRQDNAFTPFLRDDAIWRKHTAADQYRGLQDDAGDGGKTKQQKVNDLNAMLRYITQWIPHYLANDVEKNSTNIESVWNFIRKYYSFQQSEAQFMKLCSIKMEDKERPERLYQRILAHLQDNLLKKDGKLKHDGTPVGQDEDISPTVERLAVLRWMEIIDPDLPAHVARAFAHDLQSMTLKDLQPQIVDALDSFLEEIRSKRVTCSASASRSYDSTYRGRGTPTQTPRAPYNTRFRRGNYKSPAPSFPKHRPTQPATQCRVCQAEGRVYTDHSIATCDYISRADKKDMIKSFRVEIPEGLPSEYDASPVTDFTDDFEDLAIDQQE